MKGMWETKVEMWGIEVGMQKIGGEIEGNQGENLRIRVEMMNKECGEG